MAAEFTYFFGTPVVAY